MYIVIPLPKTVILSVTASKEKSPTPF